MAQAVIARSRQSIVIRASTTVMLVGLQFFFAALNIRGVYKNE
jgi:hypothetical protein